MHRWHVIDNQRLPGNIAMSNYDSKTRDFVPSIGVVERQESFATTVSVIAFAFLVFS